MINLSDALTRLARFRVSFADDELIDTASELTSADLDVIITMGAAEALDTPVPYLKDHSQSDR